MFLLFIKQEYESRITVLAIRFRLPLRRDIGNWRLVTSVKDSMAHFFLEFMTMYITAFLTGINIYSVPLIKGWINFLQSIFLTIDIIQPDNIYNL